jgi:hypothetical protein
VVFSTAVDLACAIIRALQRSSARSTEIAALIVQRVSALAILYMDAAARGDTRTTHGLTLVASEVCLLPYLSSSSNFMTFFELFMLDTA